MKTARKTPTAEQKKWMRENGYTEKQMDKFWEDNIDTNPVIRGVSKYGFTWRDMNMSCVIQLPTQKERDLKYFAEQEEQERKEKEAALAEQEKQQYYKTHFDEVILNKISSGEKLTESELSKLVYEYEVETTHGENGRWMRTNISIICLKDRYFSIKWNEGLTEQQIDDFLNQPIEVKKHTYEKTVTVTEWVKI